MVQIGSRILRSEFITTLRVCASAGAGAVPNTPPTLAANVSAATDFLKSNMDRPPLSPEDHSKNRAAAQDGECRALLPRPDRDRVATR